MNKIQECQNFIENRDTFKKAFTMEGTLMYLCGATVFSVRGKTADEQRLRACRDILKQETGAFSKLRGMIKIPMISMMAQSEDPEGLLENAIEIFDMLKKEIKGSTYLPIAAMIIAEMKSPDQFGEVVSRTGRIYAQVKGRHRFITSSEDSVFCALLALSDKDEAQLAEELEELYCGLKEHFSSSGAAQSLGFVLSLYEGTPEEKIKKTVSLFNKLREKGYKYGKGYELPVLGVLAMSSQSRDVLVRDMIEIDQWLSKQKGFGLMGGPSKRQRLMYSGLLADINSEESGGSNTAEAALMSTTISIIVAQQVAMICCVAATTSTAAAGVSA